MVIPCQSCSGPGCMVIKILLYSIISTSAANGLSDRANFPSESKYISKIQLCYSPHCSAVEAFIYRKWTHCPALALLSHSVHQNAPEVRRWSQCKLMCTTTREELNTLTKLNMTGKENRPKQVDQTRNGRITASLLTILKPAWISMPVQAG